MTDEIAEDEPFAPFARWFDLAAQSEPLAETMMLATATRGGLPSLRAVLLKGADASGFVFYTNLESRKADELVGQPARGAVLPLEVDGAAGPHRGHGQRRSADDEADAYFATRPRDSQIGAWASDQSRPLDSREALERRFA